MQNKFLKKFMVLSALGTIFLTSCGTQKKPLPGYISEDELTEIVTNFKEENIYKKYSYEGYLNHFACSDEEIPSNITSDGMIRYTDYPEEYKSSSSSSYLRLPLHITLKSWNVENINKSTRYNLESRVCRSEFLKNGLDKVYYYKRPEGGFILRTFGVNKNLQINQNNIKCSGKWNIEVEYDADGYLVKEEFATINSSEANKSECCYGWANYSFGL